MYEQVSNSAPDPAFSSVSELRESGFWQGLVEWQSEISIYQESLVQSEIRQPLVAQLYAACIVREWRRCFDKINTNEPCYILELEANDGQFAVWVLSEVEKILTLEEWSLFNPCYLISDPRAARISEMWQHDALRNWIERGNIEPIKFDVRDQSYLDIQSRQLVLGQNSMANPLIVLATGVFSSYRQSLYHIHYGHCYQAGLEVGSEVDTAKPGEALLHYNWNKIEPNASHEKIVRRYVERFDSAFVPIPFEVFDSIEVLKSFSIQGCQILSSDRGYCGERELRCQDVPQIFLASRFVLPLNGHALSWNFEGPETSVEHYASQDQGVLHSAISFQAGPLVVSSKTSEQVLTEFAEDRDLIVQDMMDLSVSAPEQLSRGQILSLLKLSRFNHQVLFLHIDQVLSQVDGFSPNEKIQWRDALREIWRVHYPLVDSTDALFQTGLLAMRLFDWKTARSLFFYLFQEFPEDGGIRSALVETMLHLGQIEEAENLALQSLILDPENSDLQQLLVIAQAWRETCEADTCFDEDLATGIDIHLRPFVPHQGEAFLCQFRDPSIAVMTALPPLTTIEDLNDWVSTQGGLESRALYSVIHKEHGFVGMVSLRWNQDRAFFYFWIGADYQGRGIGQQAARLLFRMASNTLSIETVFTCAFADNSRSRAALNQLGFRPLSVRAKSPDEDSRFYSLPCKENLAMRESEQHQHLSQLLIKIKSPIQLEECDSAVSLSRSI